MTNNKQQTAVEQFAIVLYEGGYLQVNGDEIEKLLNRFKEMEKKQMIEFARKIIMEAYATFEGNVETELEIEQYYEQQNVGIPIGTNGWGTTN
jgi:hypothetical protein